MPSNDPPVRGKLAEYQQVIASATAAFQDELKRIEEAHNSILLDYEQQIAAANAEILAGSDTERLYDHGNPARGRLKRQRVGNPLKGARMTNHHFGSNYPTGPSFGANEQTLRDKLAERIGPDIADCLVNKWTQGSHFDPAQIERITRTYGGQYDGVFDGIALKRITDIAYRQADTWNRLSNLPGETLAQSVDFVRWNSWDVRGHYITDGIYMTGEAGATLNPGDVGFRAAPGTPGYLGPYTGPTSR